MSYDYAKLSGKIVEKCGTQAVFAEKMGLSERSVSLKLNNKVPWKQQEIYAAKQILGLTQGELYACFFSKKFNDVEQDITKQSALG